MDMRIDMCINMCTDMHTDMRMGMRRDVCLGMCIDWGVGGRGQWPRTVACQRLCSFGGSPLGSVCKHRSIEFRTTRARYQRSIGDACPTVYRYAADAHPVQQPSAAAAAAAAAAAGMPAPNEHDTPALLGTSADR